MLFTFIVSGAGALTEAILSDSAFSANSFTLITFFPSDVIVTDENSKNSDAVLFLYPDTACIAAFISACKVVDPVKYVSLQANGFFAVNT